MSIRTKLFVFCDLEICLTWHEELWHASILEILQIIAISVLCNCHRHLPTMSTSLCYIVLPTPGPHHQFQK